jgi:alpha,alpha-trehalose phosphorylase (configuration-retaining)
MPLGVSHNYFSFREPSLTQLTPIRYVPNPSPSVFRTTKNNHNILQGVAPPDLRLTKAAKDNFDAWILKNGMRWTAEGGPLAPGGVDIAFIGAL